MKRLLLYQTDNEDSLRVSSHKTLLSLDSNALECVMDFSRVTPLVVTPNLSPSEAAELMAKTHTALEVVVDERDNFIGVVSFNDLQSQEVMKKVANGYSREELTISDFMKPKNKLKAFDTVELANATVADIVARLKGSGQAYCLVIDRAYHQIQGIISVADIEARLQQAIDIGNEAIFSTLCRELRPA